MTYSVVLSYDLLFKNSHLILGYNFYAGWNCLNYTHVQSLPSYYRIKESSGWKSCLEIIKSKPPAQNQGQLGRVAEGRELSSQKDCTNSLDNMCQCLTTH